MKLDLEKKLDRFYEEMDSDESWDIGELACEIVPLLEGETRRPERYIISLAADNPTPERTSK